MTVTRRAYEFDEDDRRHFGRLLGRPVALEQSVTVTVAGPPLPPELAVTQRDIDWYFAVGHGEYARSADPAYREAHRANAVRYVRGELTR